jgi:homocysteine S-methyltransferase
METDFEARKAPAYYMINCAHPAHFTSVLREGGEWAPRLRGLRANASKCSHAELDEAETLDDGNPGELGLENAALRRLVPSLTIFGGCCGTDLRHVAAIAAELSRTQKAA